MTLILNPMSYGHDAYTHKVQAQGSGGSKVRVETDRWTDGCRWTDG